MRFWLLCLRASLRGKRKLCFPLLDTEGIPFGLVALVIGLASGKSVYALYGLGFITALLLFIMAVYRGKYEAEFVLDDKGVLCRTQAKQSKKNRTVNALTVVLGLLMICRKMPAKRPTIWNSLKKRLPNTKIM